VRRTCLCQRGGVGLADVHRQRGDDQRGEGGGARERGQPTVKGGEARPGAPAAAGGGHRGVNGLVALATVGALLTPAGDDEADQGDQELDDLADGSDMCEGAQRQEGSEDRDGGYQQRHEREKARKHEREHDERAERTQHRLGQHAGALAGGLSVDQRLDAGDPHLPGRRSSGADAVPDTGGDRARGRGVAGGPEHERVGAVPVAGRECPIVRAGVVGHARGRDDLLGSGERVI
jgi:hypothetical protein